MGVQGTIWRIECAKNKREFEISRKHRRANRKTEEKPEHQQERKIHKRNENNKN